MDIQRLRNLTTGKLHTDIEHVYQDLERLLDKKDLMTPMLPAALRSVEPWLREHVTDPRFWNGEWEPEHIGEIELPEPGFEDRIAMFDRYNAQPNPLNDKKVIVLCSPRS